MELKSSGLLPLWTHLTMTKNITLVCDMSMAKLTHVNVGC